jgi:hypothetical protein
VAFVSLRDNLDLSTPSGRPMFHVIAAMEVERELIAPKPPHRAVVLLLQNRSGLKRNRMIPATSNSSDGRENDLISADPPTPTTRCFSAVPPV